MYLLVRVLDFRDWEEFFKTGSTYRELSTVNYAK